MASAYRSPNKDELARVEKYRVNVLVRKHSLRKDDENWTDEHIDAIFGPLNSDAFAAVPHRIDTKRIAEQILKPQYFTDLRELLISSGYEKGDEVAHHYIGRLFAAAVCHSIDYPELVRDGPIDAAFHWISSSNGNGPDRSAGDWFLEINDMLEPYTHHVELLHFRPEHSLAMRQRERLTDVLGKYYGNYNHQPDSFDDLFDFEFEDAGLDGEIVADEPKEGPPTSVVLSKTAYELNEAIKLNVPSNFHPHDAWKFLKGFVQKFPSDYRQILDLAKVQDNASPETRRFVDQLLAVLEGRAGTAGAMTAV